MFSLSYSVTSHAVALSFQQRLDFEAPEGYNPEPDLVIVEDHHVPERQAARAARDAKEAGPPRQAARATKEADLECQDVPEGHLIPARRSLGSFLNAEKTAIYSPEHEATMIGLMQLASGHPNGI